MRLIDKGSYVFVVTLMFALLLINIAYLKYTDDPRFIDNVLAEDEMNLWDKFTMYFGMLSIFLIWITSVLHSFKRTSKGLAILMFFIGPITFVYYWEYSIKRMFLNRDS